MFRVHFKNHTLYSLIAIINTSVKLIVIVSPHVRTCVYRCVRAQETSEQVKEEERVLLPKIGSAPSLTGSEDKLNRFHQLWLRLGCHACCI